MLSKAKKISLTPCLSTEKHVLHLSKPKTAQLNTLCHHHKVNTVKMFAYLINYSKINLTFIPQITQYHLSHKYFFLITQFLNYVLIIFTFRLLHFAFSKRSLIKTSFLSFQTLQFKKTIKVSANLPTLFNK